MVPAAAEFEAAQFALDGAGERAKFVAEEFAFHQLRRKAGAINFQERRVAARAKFVDEAGEMIFAGATFAADEQRRRSGGHFLRQFEKPQRCWIFRDPRQSLRAHLE